MKRGTARGLSAATVTLTLSAAVLGLAPAAHAASPATPTVPTGLQVGPVEPALFGAPTEGCGSTPAYNWGYLPDGATTLTAKADSSAATIVFHVQDTQDLTTDVVTGTGTVGADGTASVALDTSKLLDNHSYAWRAVSQDSQGQASAASPDCHFRIDRTAPTISVQDRPSQFPPHLDGWELTAQYSHVAQADGSVPSGCLEYRLNADTAWTRPACSSTAALVSTVIAFTQPGTNTVHLRALDQAGNYTAETQKTFTVYPGPTQPGDLWDPADQWQLSRDRGAADLFGYDSGRLAPAGNLTYVDNSATANARPLPSTVAHFDGTATLGNNGKPVVGTGDFTVTAWARAAAGGGVAVSTYSGGSTLGGFILWASQWDNNWHFEMRSGNPNNPWDDTVVLPGAAVKYGTWQQLTATYNEMTGFLQLYVDGWPAASGYHAITSANGAGNQFQLGGSGGQGASWNFKGDLSDVAVHARTANYPARSGAYSTGAGYSCIDAAGGGNADGTRIDLWTCNGGANQTYTLDRPDGTIQSMGKCLDVTGNATNNGAALELWTCNGGKNQTWEPRADGSLFNPQSGRCVDLPYGSTTAGNMLQLWDCNGGTNQQWNLPRAPYGMVPLQ
ncbi:ricin-type beta-trefoil lectin domain protein [Kitasatospora sp. NPDC058965]|uniref:ricin-type beta-trefoil lectin domain protein n=1 Tax=Kitasatospora sp. NPDC058965 TaxID=3346682 RepID=UPI0036A75764